MGSIVTCAAGPCQYWLQVDPSTNHKVTAGSGSSVVCYDKAKVKDTGVGVISSTESVSARVQQCDVDGERVCKYK